MRLKSANNFNLAALFLCVF